MEEININERERGHGTLLDNIGVGAAGIAAVNSEGHVRRMNGSNRRPLFGLIDLNHHNSHEREYVIPNYDYQFTTDNVDGLMVELQERAHKLAISADRNAKIIKAVLIASQVMLIVMGIAITVLSLNQCTFGSTSTKYVVGVLGALVTGIEGIRSTFELNKRGNLYRVVHNKALEVTRKARMLKLSHMSAEQLELKIHSYYERLCQLDISLYSLRVVKFNRGENQELSPPISGDWPRNRASPGDEDVLPSPHAGTQQHEIRGVN